jgi:hypothetical protein
MPLAKMVALAFVALVGCARLPVLPPPPRPTPPADLPVDVPMRPLLSIPAGEQMRVMLAAAFLPCLLCHGCLEIERVSLEIDIRAKRMRLAFANITSDLAPKDAAEDARALREMITSDDKIAWVTESLELRYVKVEARKVIDTGSRLDGEMSASFERLGEAGISGYDAKRPYRYCPPGGMSVVAANASFRDSRGCVVWEDTAQVLRIDLAPHSRPKGTSILGAWRDQGK